MSLHEAQACVVPPELGLALLRWTAKKYRPKVAQSTARALVGDELKSALAHLQEPNVDPRGHFNVNVLKFFSEHTRRCYVCKYHVTVHRMVSI